MKNQNLKSLDVKIKFFGRAKELYYAGAPSLATSGAAGFDLRAVLAVGGEVFIEAGERLMFNSGLAIEPLRLDIAAFVFSRSGLGAMQGLVVAQGVGIIDPDYRGEIKIPLLNTSKERRSVKHGDRIAQMVFQEFYQANFLLVEELGNTTRGAGGFGHTGLK